jgi:hypothetical protein
MNIILEQFKNNFESYIIKIKEENELLKIQIKDLEEKNSNLEQENINQKNIIEELNKEKKLKSSSTLWETLNSQISEKDTIIEKLKKDIEFYKRTETKNVVNIRDKYQSSLLASFLESNSTEQRFSKSNSNLNNTIQTTENNIFKIIDNEKKEKVINDEEIIINDNKEVYKKSKDKTKEKSKDKSEKKKNKKIIQEEEDELEELEKELAGI